MRKSHQEPSYKVRASQLPGICHGGVITLSHSITKTLDPLCDFQLCHVR